MNFVLTESDLFLIRVKEICFGNATIEMVLGDHTIEFMPSYIGREPLTTLIDSLNEFELEEWDDFTITWADEPGCWKIELKYDRQNSHLDMEIYHYDDDIDFNAKRKGVIDMGHSVSMPYMKYHDEVIRTVLYSLKKYGLRGLNGNWCDGTDSFAINGLMRLLGTESNFPNDSDECYSDIFAELDILRNALEHVKEL